MKKPSEELPRVLIVDDDPIVCESMNEVLRSHGFRTATAFNGPEALDMLTDARRNQPDRPADPFHVTISDLSLPKMDGTEFLKRVVHDHPDTVVVVVTAYGTIESAVQAIKLGAFEYLTHPVIEDELVMVIEKASRQGSLLARNSQLKQQLDDRFGLDNIIGGDPRMLKIYDLIQAVAPTKTTVLMTGESGTGKSMIARAIHLRSAVADGPFVELACGSIPETLLESELFGHVKGAFTGAHADKVGRFLAANGGTVFLDEINSASPGMQLKLLRVLQEKQFEPVGSTETVEVDVRVILASNQPLEELVSKGQFRQDLYYRINVVKIELPPLRERVGDIMVLAEHFLEQYSEEVGREVVGFTHDAQTTLQRYTFPGNVRELENIIERAVVLTRHAIIESEDLPPVVLQNKPFGAPGVGGLSHDNGTEEFEGKRLVEAMETHERRVILAALNANNWNRQRTAEQLGINRTTLYKKMRSYRLDEVHRAG